MRLKNLLLLTFSVFIILSATGLHAEKAKKHSLGFDFSIFNLNLFMDDEPDSGGYGGFFNIDINLYYDHYFVKYFSLGTELTYFHLIDIANDFVYNSCRINLRVKAVLPFHHDKIESYFLTRGGFVIGDSRRGFIMGADIFGGFGFNFLIKKNFWLGILFDTGAEFLSYKYFVDCERMCGDCSILGWHQARALLTLNYRF